MFAQDDEPDFEVGWDASPGPDGHFWLHFWFLGWRSAKNSIFRSRTLYCSRCFVSSGFDSPITTNCPNVLLLCLVLPVSNSKLCLGLSGLFSRDQYILRMSHLRFHGIVYTPEQFWHTLYYNIVSTPVCIYPFSICKSNSLTTRVTRQNVAKYNRKDLKQTRQ